MNLKFYMRGLGIGIIVTAVIMLVLSYQNSQPLSDAEIKQRASELGMVEESETLLSMVKNEEPTETPQVAEPEQMAEITQTTESGQATETSPTTENGQVTETSKPTEDDNSADNPQVTEASEEAKSSEDNNEGLSEEKLAEIEQLVNDANDYLEDKNPKDVDVKNEEPSNESEDVKKPQSSESKVYTLSVSKGENSYDIAKNLQKMGLIADAAAFDTYLCQNKIDTKIYSGKYDIPEGSSEEEVARIITGSR